MSFNALSQSWEHELSWVELMYISDGEMCMFSPPRILTNFVSSGRDPNPYFTRIPNPLCHSLPPIYVLPYAHFAVRSEYHSHHPFLSRIFRLLFWSQTDNYGVSYRWALSRERMKMLVIHRPGYQIQSAGPPKVSPGSLPAHFSSRRPIISSSGVCACVHMYVCFLRLFFFERRSRLFSLCKVWANSTRLSHNDGRSAAVAASRARPPGVGVRQGWRAPSRALRRHRAAGIGRWRGPKPDPQTGHFLTRSFDE